MFNIFTIRRFVIQYRLTDYSISIRLFGLIPIYRIKLMDITETSCVSLRDLLPWKRLAWRVGGVFLNRWTSTVVYIRAKRWFLFDILISPDDPEDFVAKLNVMLEKGKNM